MTTTNTAPRPGRKAPVMRHKTWTAAIVLAVALPVGGPALVNAWGSVAGQTVKDAAAKTALSSTEARSQAELEALSKDPQAKAEVLKAKEASAAEHEAESRAARTVQPQVRPQGIVEGREAPASGSVFLGRNRWMGSLSGTPVRVYAGQAGVGSPDGMVLMVTEKGEGTFSSRAMYRLAGAGPLHVTSVSGARVTLKGDNGRTHVLDLTTGAFLS